MLWIAALAAAASLAAAEPVPTSPLAKLAGSWVGEGQWMGAPARATLAWDSVLNGRFTRLAYQITKTADPAVAFEGHAYYAADADGRVTATWFDSQGAVYALEVDATADTLTAVWGPAGAPRGRTTYRLMAEDRLEVVDEIKTKDGAWKEFARIGYERSGTR